MASTTSVGNVWSRSHASACGAISDCAKSRTTLRNASCSSVRSKCTPEEPKGRRRDLGGLGDGFSAFRRASRDPDAVPSAPRSQRTLGGSFPLAVVGGQLCTELRDVTTDLAALDSTGFWVVVLPYEGEPLCARFDKVRARRAVAGPPVAGTDGTVVDDRPSTARPTATASDHPRAHRRRRGVPGQPLPDPLRAAPGRRRRRRPRGGPRRRQPRALLGRRAPPAAGRAHRLGVARAVPAPGRDRSSSPSRSRARRRPRPGSWPRTAPRT